MEREPEGIARFANLASRNLRMRYEEDGVGEPLILIHGGGMTGRLMWSEQIPVFAEHFRVIAPDSRGHGGTHNPAGELSYHAMAEDVIALMDALEIERAFYYGYSDGGNIGLELGMRFPDRMVALALGGVLFKFSPSYFAALRREHGVERVETDEDLEAFQRALPKNMREHVLARHTHTGPETWQNMVVQIARLHTTPVHYSVNDLARVVSPTLVMTGDRDAFLLVEETVELYRLLPNAELLVLPNSDHMPWAPFTEHALRFLLHVRDEHAA